MADGPRWLAENERAAWLAFLTSSALVGREIEQRLRAEAGLSHPQYEILVRLADAPGGELRMAELADAVLSTRSGITYQVTQLERLGLVTRRSCPTDVRGVFAVLTEEGRSRLEAAAPGHVEVVRNLLIDVLTPEELTVIAEALGKVTSQARRRTE